MNGCDSRHGLNDKLRQKVLETRGKPVRYDKYYITITDTYKYCVILTQSEPGLGPR